ncbi:MAG: spore cortex biosynthesis protein YabQ [Clostridiales bacterium]|nr:spore cortex biosynthesis protein YabQ [Clostridiales bacterium]
MSAEIATEAGLLVMSAGLGGMLALLYGVLRMLRRLFRHGWLLVGLEDLAYWVFCGFAVFYLLYRENDGVLRLYVIGTVLLALAAWDRLFSAIFSVISGKVLKIMGRCLKIKRKNEKRNW